MINIEQVSIDCEINHSKDGAETRPKHKVNQKQNGMQWNL